MQAIIWEATWEGVGAEYKSEGGEEGSQQGWVNAQVTAVGYRGSLSLWGHRETVKSTPECHRYPAIYREWGRLQG